MERLERPLSLFPLVPHRSENPRVLVPLVLVPLVPRRSGDPLLTVHFHPKTLFEIAMALSRNSGSFPSNSHVSATFSILLRFGESWIPTNSEKFTADGSQMGRTNLDKSVC